MFNKPLTVLDINPGIGGRSFVFSRLGFKVTAAVEASKDCQRVFAQINPDIPILEFEPTVCNLDKTPAADILSAKLEISHFSLYPRNPKADIFDYISEILYRDTPKAFVFQASAAMLRNSSLNLFDKLFFEKYSVSYQVFSDSDYSGFPVTGTQLYIIGIRKDIYADDFYFPEPPHTEPRELFTENASRVDEWYRRLSYNMSRFTVSENFDSRKHRFYFRPMSATSMKEDVISVSFFREDYYCDEIGLRRLTHNECATLKGYDECGVDFNGYTGRYAMYNMLSSAADINIFKPITAHLRELLSRTEKDHTSEADSAYGKPEPKDSKAERLPANKKKPAEISERKFITPRNRLLNVSISRLKGLRNLDISFSKNLTAIMGVNCSGKSTVLHALACAFEPIEEGENHKFNFFFTPNPDALWNGSELTVTYLDENTKLRSSRRYQKKTDRWSPRYKDRPKRETFFAGIDTCLPEIEKERQTSYISYSTAAVTDRQAKKI